MSDPRSDINQLLVQVKYNFQVLRRLVDLAEDSNVNIANCSFQTGLTRIILMRRCPRYNNIVVNIRFINKPYVIQAVGAVYHDIWKFKWPKN